MLNILKNSLYFLLVNSLYLKVPKQQNVMLERLLLYFAPNVLNMHSHGGEILKLS